MKKSIILIISCLLAFTAGCDSTLNDASKGKKGSRFVSQFKYLDQMYTKEKGEALNEKYLTGEVFERYPDAVKEKLNVYLQFPFRSLKSSTSAKSMSVGARGLFDGDWWESLPEEILEYCKQQGIDVLSEGLSEGLINFLESDEGKAYIESYLNDVEQRLKDIVDYSIAEFEEEYDTEVAILLASGGFIAISEGVMAGSSVYAAMTGAISMTINPLSSVLTAASMIQSYYQHQEMMAQLERIEALLGQIQSSLDRIEGKIDKILGYTIDINTQLKYEQAQSARIQLRLIERQLTYLQNINDENSKDLIRDYISEANLGEGSFQLMMECAFESAINTQEWLFNEGYIQKFELDNVVVDRLQVFPSNNLNPTFVNSYVTYSLPRPSNFIIIENGNKKYYFNYNDILLFVKLSKARLSLAEIVYQGDELLQYRKRIAQFDLNNYFIPIENAINNISTSVQQKIKEIATYEKLQLKAKNSTEYYVLEYNNTPLVYGQTSNLLTSLVIIYLENQFNVNLENATGTEYAEIEPYIQQTLLKAYFENEDNIEQITQLKALNTAWMMTLQAHIDAAE